ncbi:MAG: hypothetical protein HY537_17830 [Deltaproteobacteria bacterium]|nr:hypothetical protein [Deltaproteobacteria bacterium]
MNNCPILLEISAGQSTGRQTTLRVPDKVIRGSLGFDEEISVVFLNTSKDREIGTIVAFDLSKAQAKPITRIIADSYFYSVALSPDRTQVAAGAFNGYFSIWDVGWSDNVYEDTFDGVAISTEFSNDGTLVVAGMEDGVIRIIETNTGKPVREIRKFSRRTFVRATISPDGDKIAGLYGNGAGAIYRTNGVPWLSFEIPNITILKSPFLRFSPSGHSLISAYVPLKSRSDGSRHALSGRLVLDIWNIQWAQRRVERKIVMMRNNQQIQNGMVGTTTNGMEFLPNGEQLAVATTGGQIQMVDLKSGEVIAVLEGMHKGGVTSLAVNAELNWLVSGSTDGSVVLWDLAKMQPFSQITGIKKPVTELRFQGANRLLIGTGLIEMGNEYYIIQLESSP